MKYLLEICTCTLVFFVAISPSKLSSYMLKMPLKRDKMWEATVGRESSNSEKFENFICL